MTSTFDRSLLDARDQARAALAEVTDPRAVGVDDGYEVEGERVVTLLFECRLEGYLGWRWAASVTRVDDESPVTVLEVELLPGDGAVLAPEWVPWSERLAQYREAQVLQAAEEAAAAQAAAEELADGDDSDSDDDDDILDNDFSDFDDEIDGVDIDELDEDADDGSDDDRGGDDGESAEAENESDPGKN